MARRKLEAMIPSSERWPIREAVLEVVEHLQFHILQHSKSSTEILSAVQIMRKPHEQQPDQREAFEQRLAQIKSRA